MMHLSATVQANFDFSDEADMAVKVRTAMGLYAFGLCALCQLAFFGENGERVCDQAVGDLGRYGSGSLRASSLCLRVGLRV